MLRNILSVTIGLLVSFVVIMLGEGISYNIFPLPASNNLSDPDVMKNYIMNAPAAFHIIILVIYCISSFIGAFMASVITINKKMTNAITVGGILMGLGVFNLVSLSHPTWAIICGLFAFIPFAYLAGLLGLKISTKKK